MALVYDSNGRAFFNGERIPRTTQICALLAPRWPAHAYYLRKGKLIHLITEWEDSEELDESSVDPNLFGYLEAYRSFKRITRWKTLQSEISFFHEKYRYCGRADKIGFFDSKWNWVIDIKSGQPHESDKLQAPAYLFGLKSQGEKVERCGDVYLGSDGTFKFVEVCDPTERFLKFLAGLKKWRENGNSE